MTFFNHLRFLHRKVHRNTEVKERESFHQHTESHFNSDPFLVEISRNNLVIWSCNVTNRCGTTGEHYEKDTLELEDFSSAVEQNK